MLYRIYTNDRGSKKGIAMYSALCLVEAPDQLAARRMCPPEFDAPNFAPAMAICSRENSQTKEEKEWLKKHVG